MKHYFDTDGHEFTTPPDPFKGRSPMHLPDGSYNDDAFRDMGGTIEDDGEPTHWELLDAACDKFVVCCNKIGQFIGNPDFTGGIDEIDELRAFAATLTDPAQITQALWLVAEWEGCDKECNHWASKDDVGLASPAWWWYCWSRYAQQLERNKK